MKATAWSSGGGTFGVRVGKENRDKHFVRTWSRIEVDVDGKFCEFALTNRFWNKCPEFRDSGDTVIQNWLQRHHTIDWSTGQPPRFQLLPLGGVRFRLVG
jgi:hypothetical protein